MRSFIGIGILFLLFTFGEIETPQRSNIIVVNDFNTDDFPGRKKKKELFAELADTAAKRIAQEASIRWNMNTIILDNPGFQINHGDMERLMDEHKAARIIYLDWVEVEFVQTRVEVEKDESGKSRTAYYDICGEVKVTHMDHLKKMRDAQEKVCEFFTDRSVVSGLFAAGPDVVAKKKYTFPMIEKAAVRLVRRL